MADSGLIGHLTLKAIASIISGNYGAKFTNTKCMLSFPNEVGYKEDGEFPDPEKVIFGLPPHPVKLLHAIDR